MRSLVTAAVLILISANAFGTPCKAGNDHRKLDQVHIENIQVKQVNSMKEDWRLDPKKTAQHEVLEAKLNTLAFQKADQIPLTSVKSEDREQVFAYSEHGVRYEITVKRPEWLLPYSGIYKMMMWVVTDVKTVCTK